MYTIYSTLFIGITLYLNKVYYLYDRIHIYQSSCYIYSFNKVIYCIVWCVSIGTHTPLIRLLFTLIIILQELYDNY